MYHKYDFRKIRTQLFADKIYINQQIIINRKYGEVLIEFKTIEEQQVATIKMKINYFSME
jgi:hypothetical protein